MVLQQAECVTVLANEDGIAIAAGFPAVLKAEVDDIGNPSQVEEFRYLGDEHLGARCLTSFDADLGALRCGVGDPAVLDVIEADNFGAFAWDHCQ